MVILKFFLFFRCFLFLFFLSLNFHLLSLILKMTHSTLLFSMSSPFHRFFPLLALSYLLAQIIGSFFLGIRAIFLLLRFENVYDLSIFPPIPIECRIFSLLPLIFNLIQQSILYFVAFLID